MKQKVSQIDIRKYLWIFIFLLCFIFLSVIFSDILAILIVSLLIAMILNPAVDFLEKQGFNRLISVLLVFLLCGSLLLLIFSYLLPKVFNQMNSLAQIITPESLSSIFKSIELFIQKLFPFLNTQNLINRVSIEFQNLLFGWINNVSSILYSIFSILALLVIVPFITFFLLKDNKKIIKGIINIMPNKYFEVSYWVIKKISIQLGRFVRGWILDAAIVGILAGIGLSILGINNAVSIGFIAGVGHLIPYFGPVIGGIPAIIISIIQLGNFSMLPKIILMFALVYIFDNGYIQPKVFSKSTDMHPLIIIILVLIGGKLLGVFGMLLAVPAATVIKTAAKEIYYGYKNYKIIRT
ncbi:MAG: AI-2E family transporter [Melioribacter sp.]|uniref:AI-2E family transporter n=1 Tax=Rosettibacter primus TaxID=3111523 RepID=UPI00247BCC53|nr:AI-2E family transporter [Melioribacter sp.]